ncbi:MAG: hypothetical protein ACXVAY_00855 [Mucilaginibacter sp.]
MFAESDIIDPKEKEYHWIKNNLHIFLHKTLDGTVINYINLPAEQTMDKKTKTEKDSASAATSKDI